MSTNGQQPDQIAQRTAAILRRSIHDHQHHIAELTRLLTHIQPLAAPVTEQWTSAQVVDLHPGDIVNCGGTEAEVLHVGWCDTDKRLITVDFPGTHGGSFEREYRWDRYHAVQVREQRHRRLVEEAAIDDDHTHRSHATPTAADALPSAVDEAKAASRLGNDELADNLRRFAVAASLYPPLRRHALMVEAAHRLAPTGDDAQPGDAPNLRLAAP